jgi:hypothetical protein
MGFFWGLSIFPLQINKSSPMLVVAKFLCLTFVEALLLLLLLLLEFSWYFSLKIIHLFILE